MQSHLTQAVSPLMNSLKLSVAALMLAFLAACAFAPPDPAVTDERQVTVPSERQVTRLLEKKLQSNVSEARVLDLDVTESWVDREGRLRLICVAQIDGGPPTMPMLGYERVQVRKLELFLEKERWKWHPRRVKALGSLQLLPAVDT